MRKAIVHNSSGTCVRAAISLGWLLVCASSLTAQNYGSLFYSYVNFPGENWPDAAVPATSVSIGNPTGIATDSAGNVYIAGPSIIFKLDTSGMLTRIAGDGHNGYSGDGGLATSAELGFPLATPNDLDWGDAMGGIAVDSSGTLYIADMFNNRVRAITSDGIISSVWGDGSPEGLWLPVGVAIDSAGRLYVADGATINQVTSDGLKRPVVGNDCGHLENPGVCAPEGIAVDATGNIYVADGYCRVRRISADGTITTVAGDERPSGFFTFTCGYSGDNGPATSASLVGPYGVAVDTIGNLYIADPYNNCVREVSADGIITTFAGRCQPWAGPYLSGGGYSGDGGPATNAQLALPHAVAVDTNGNVYISDTGNFVVRKVTADGIITTVAGNGVWQR
jgi:hypothetical protein